MSAPVKDARIALLEDACRRIDAETGGNAIEAAAERAAAWLNARLLRLEATKRRPVSGCALENAYYRWRFANRAWQSLAAF